MLKRIKYRIILALFSFIQLMTSSNLCGQDITVTQRGDVGRTGAFNTKGLSKTTDVLWTSQKIYKNVPTSSTLVEIISVLGVEIKSDKPSYIFASSIFSSDMVRNLVNNVTETAPLFFKNTVFLSMNFGDGFVIAIEADSGKIKWFYRHPKATISKPLIKNDFLFAVSSDGTLHCLDTQTGKVNWKFKQENMNLSHASFVESNGVLFISAATSERVSGYGSLTTYNQDSKLYAIDIGTQKVLWEFDSKGYPAPPTFGNKTVFICNGKYLISVDATNGKEKWRFETKAHSTVFSNGVVYFEGNKNIYAVESTSGQLKWKTKARGYIFTLMAVDNDSLFYAGSKKNLFAVDTANGKERWVFKTKRTCTEPVVANDMVYVGGENQFFIINAKTGALIEEVKVNGNWISSPAVTDDRLFFRNDNGYVFAIK